MRAILLAGALALVAHQPARAQVARAIVKTGDVLSGPTGTYTFTYPIHPFSHRAGGRGSLVGIQDSAGNDLRGYWGSRGGEPDSLLRAPTTIGGLTQVSFLTFDSDAMAEAGEIHYFAALDDNAGGFLSSVWAGDTLMYLAGDPVPDLPGMVWSYARHIKPTESFGPIVAGRVEPAGGGQPLYGLWAGSPLTTVLLSGMQLPGFSYPLGGAGLVQWGYNSNRVGVSRSGNHRLVVVALDSGAVNNGPTGVTLDGVPLFVDGFVLESLRPTPPSIAPFGTWLFFHSAWVDDAGSWQLLAEISDGVGGGATVLLQDGVEILRSGDSVPGVGAYQQLGGFHANDSGDRAVMAKIGNQDRVVLNGELLFSQGDPVDFDGDGAPDPEYTAFITSSAEDYAMDEDGTILIAASLLGPGGFSGALLEIRGYGLGSAVCSPSVVNSTGLSAEIGAGGSAVAGGRPLWLRSSNVPTNQFGYFLASRTQGFVANPGGSQGNLCLGGAIGRFVGQVGNSGTAGALEIDVDTSAIPVTPVAPILAGQSWTFQAWFRDTNPGPTSNFTDAVEVTFE